MRAIQQLRKVRPAYAAWCALWSDVRFHLENGVELEVEIRKPKRNLDQNALLHASIDEIAERVEWAGKKREAEIWKRLLVAAWLRAVGSQVEVLPALDGHGVDLVYAPTSSLSREQMSELIEYVESWKAVHMPEAASAE